LRLGGKKKGRMEPNNDFRKNSSDEKERKLRGNKIAMRSQFWGREIYSSNHVISNPFWWELLKLGTRNNFSIVIEPHLGKILPKREEEKKRNLPFMEQKKKKKKKLIGLFIFHFPSLFTSTTDGDHGPVVRLGYLKHARVWLFLLGNRHRYHCGKLLVTRTWHQHQERN
jgi:hypothetical protein